MLSHASVLKPEFSLVLAGLPQGILEASHTREYLHNELQWHYSTHYLAECRGEEVLEDIRQLVHGNAARNLIDAQTKDESVHVELFEAELSKIGLNDDARTYSDGYSRLVLEQKTLAEKIYSFQIMTEAVSSAYCAWRLNAVSDPSLSHADRVVFEDEQRHLLMGKKMLDLCDPEELEHVLTPARRKELFREMSQICKRSMKDELVSSIVRPEHRDLMKTTFSTLDRMVVRCMMANS